MSDNTRGNEVTPETMLAIQKENAILEEKLEKKFEKLFEKQTKDLKEFMIIQMQIPNKDLDRISEDVDDLKSRVLVLEQKQYIEEGEEAGTQKTNSSRNKNTEMTIGKIAIIATIIGLLGSFITWLLEKI